MKDKTALITGASSGIGAAIARRFAAAGANVALIYAGNTAGAESVKADCEAAGVTAEIYQCDVTDFDKVKETVGLVKKEFGLFDILVNNAGITKDNLIPMMKEADFDAVVDTNLKGSFNMIRHCIPVFMRNKRGKIVNISSVVGLMGNAGQANYAASKAGVIGLTKSVAREMAAKNITCNAVAPGFIRTRMTEDLDEEGAMAAGIPMKRTGSPEEVAEAALFLASEASDYITGEVLRVDGGLGI